MNLNNNHITGITNTISACTSLITLNLSYNDLLSLPILPNTVRNLYLQGNDLVGMSSLPASLPSSLVNFNASSIIGGNGGTNTFTNWNIPISGLTNLTTFTLVSVSLTGWTTQFPTSVKNVNLNGNNLQTFDFNYLSGTTNLILSGLGTNQLTGVTNLTGATGLIYLDLSQNLLTNQYNIIPLGSTFPSSLTGITFFKNQLVNWSTSFSNCTVLRNINFQNCSLIQSSVDYIICNFTGTSVVGGTLSLNNITNVSFFNSAPSGPASTVGTGLWCKAQLTAAPKNWTVTNA